MFYQLPPVGNPVRLSCEYPAEDLIKTFGDAYQPYYFASGTAALAAAISVAIRLKAIDEPEVILPAYGCPDLISAAIFAGAKPVLVDLEADRPWMNLEQLSAKLNEKTVAIIAVNLFGISERLEQLRPLAEKEGALLIEDSAQAFPSGGENNIWQGDLVVLSFGRGKPVSLLGGGAVLHDTGNSRADELTRLLSEGNSRSERSRKSRIAFWLKAKLYNGMISPRLYWLPQSLPFLHLGETRFHPLKSLEGIDPLRLSMLASNVKAYQHDSMTTQNKLYEMLGQSDLSHSDITDLSRSCENTKERRLLRYPLLVGKAIRDQLYSELQRYGLGVSRMYPTILPEISGLEALQQQGEFPEASSFAKRLLTLPTHSQVSQMDIDKMCQIISADSGNKRL